MEIKKLGLKSLKSLKNIESEINQADSQHQIDNPTINQNQLKPFTLGQAVGVLAELANTKASQNEKMVINSNFDLNETNIEFKLLNKIQLDIFYEIKQEIVDFLRKKLHNQNIQIDGIIITEETKAKPRTEQEKFEAMALKNPNIKQLKEILDLDLLF